MAGALDAVIARLATLPPEEQDRVARWLLDELRDEEHWSSQFGASQNALGELAAEARADRATGRTTALDHPGPRAEFEVFQELYFDTYFADFRALPPVPEVPVSVLMHAKLDPATWAAAEYPCEPQGGLGDPSRGTSRKESGRERHNSALHRAGKQRPPLNARSFVQTV